jgi:hypothetical protein
VVGFGLGKRAGRGALSLLKRPARFAADYDAMLRYLVRGRIRLAYTPDVLVSMRVGGESNRSLGRLV